MNTIGVTTERPSRPAIRCRRSAAALREKVSTRIWSGVSPRRSIRSTTDSTSVVVLPVPGPGQHQQRPARVVDHRLLGRVQLRRHHPVGRGAVQCVHASLCRSVRCLSHCTRST